VSAGFECATLAVIDLQEEATLLAKRFTLFAAGGLVLLLQACAAAPPASESSSPEMVAPAATTPVTSPEVLPAAAPEVAPVTTPVVSEQEPAAEVVINLQDPAAAECTPVPGSEPTYLDRGFTLLAAGDHREAVNYFRRYQRLESSPGASWEAGIAVAYAKMLPDSPYYNWRAAREDYLQLMREKPQSIKEHQTIVLMQQALAVFSDLHVRINDLQKEKRMLSEDLEKRDEAIRRLRELTLGQKE